MPPSPQTEVRPRRAASRLLRDPWALLAAALVLLAARWMQAPGPGVVAGALVVVLGLGAATWRAGRLARWRRIGLVVAGAVFVLVAAAHHRELGRLERDAALVRATRAQEGATALQREFEAVDRDLERLARLALDGPREAGAAFDHLAALVPAGVDRAVVVARGGRPFAWTGRLLVPVDSLPGPAGILATPFYVVAYAIEHRAEDVAVATALVHAERPADQLSRPLDAAVAERAGVERFLYGSVELAEGVSDAVVLRMRGEGVLAARATVAPVEVLRLEAGERVLPRAGAALAAMVLLLITTAWRRDTRLGARLGALAVAFAALAMVPLSAFSNVSPVFDPAYYFVRGGSRFTANAAALAITCTLLLLGLLSAIRARVGPRSRTQALLGVIAVAGVGPFLLRDLARGIQVPGVGIPPGLWLAWQVTLFLAAVTVLLLGVTAGRSALGARRGLPGWVAPLTAAVAALAAPLLLEAPGRFPGLYTLLWVIAIGALALTRRARAMVVPVAFVAACGAVTLVWFSSVRDRVDLATRDVQGLRVPDRGAAVLLQRYVETLDPARAARSRVEVLAIYASSDLSASDYPVEVATWSAAGEQLAELRVGRGPGAPYGVNMYAREAQLGGRPVLREVAADPGVHLVLAVPHADGTATTVVAAPRTRLVTPDPFGAFLGFSPPPAPEPPYALRLGDPLPADDTPEGPGARWTREGSELHGDWQVPAAGGATRRIHATVELRSVDALVVRGALLVLLDLAMLGAVWLLIVLADGALTRWWRLRRRDLLNSFRARTSVALFACFVVPSALFALWSFQRLQADDRQARDLLVRETLRGVAASADSAALAPVAARFETPLFLYADGLLVQASDPLLDALAPVGRLLPPEVVRTLSEGDEPTAGREAVVGPAEVRLGYRAEYDRATGTTFVLAAPARLDDRLLDRRRNDLALFLLFALALGALAALWASGAASRQLSRPVGELQASALALARGEPAPPLDLDPPVEFTPVFSAFRKMTGDLAESRAALETAERRLAATLRNVASGVVAVDEGGRVTFANPRAEEVLARRLAAGTSIPAVAGAPLADALARFQAGEADDDEVEFERDGRRLQVRFARIARGTRRVVVTLDDVTDVARAERVLAWGEMARQVAHEIKNPLTPIRLGMQHLRRARRDGRVDFDRVLEENTARVLAEIDRLDEIARAFSRYGSAPVEDAPAEVVDAGAIARDVLELERMGAEGEIAWEAEIPARPAPAMARDRELREVLLNLLENARQAHAKRIAVRVEVPAAGGAVIRVEDDGDGIPEHLLTRVFEPHFSTRTSGSGLGLAISRRLIEGWGGTIAAESATGRGTTLVVTLSPPPPD